MQKPGSPSKVDHRGQPLMWWLIARRRASCLGLAGLVLLVHAGCARSPKPSPDQPFLDALEGYGPKYQLSPDGRVIELTLEGKRVDDEALSQVRNFSELKGLSLYGSSITDNGLANLKDLRKLESIGLGKTRVTRRGLAHLERLPSLRWMWLSVHAKLSEWEIKDFQRRAVPDLRIFLQE